MLGSFRTCCQLSKKESCVGLATYHLTILSIKIFNKDTSKVQDLVAAQRWNGWTIFTSKDLGNLLIMSSDRNKWRRCCVKYAYSPYDSRIIG